MSKVGSQLIQAAEEALAYARGELKPASGGPREGGGPNVYRFHDTPDLMNVRFLREDMGLSRQQFADVFGFAVDELADWELGRRSPEGSARAFLKVIRWNPQEALRALGQVPETLRSEAKVPEAKRPGQSLPEEPSRPGPARTARDKTRRRTPA
jgi:putative transcriptional regulator